MNDPALDGIIDFHAHAFPDALAERPSRTLRRRQCQGLPRWEGLLLAGFHGQCRHRAARWFAPLQPNPNSLRPFQVVARDRLTEDYSASLGPSQGPDPVGKAQLVAQAGLPGIKLHPYYQDFELDDPALFHFFRVLEQIGLLVVCHTGFDFAFPRDRRADPVRIVRLLDKFPNLKFVATHTGAWDDWDEVERHLLASRSTWRSPCRWNSSALSGGVSFSTAHPPECILFGTGLALDQPG